MLTLLLLGFSHALRIGASLVTVPVLGMGLEVCHFLRLLLHFVAMHSGGCQ